MRKRLLSSVLAIAMLLQCGTILSNNDTSIVKAKTSNPVSVETASDYPGYDRSAVITDGSEDPEPNRVRDDAKSSMAKNGISLYAAKAQTLASANPYTGLTYTHSDAFNGMNIYHGIDVSKYNGTINWQTVKKAGIEYVFIRIGYRGYGSGSLAADPQYETYIQGALAAGLHVGVYYFTEAKNTKEAIEEANYCLDHIKDYDVTMPVVIDYEYQYVDGKNVSRKAGLSLEAATANVTAFCNTISNAGYTPMVYANPSDLRNLINGEQLAKSYLIWLANYTTKTSYTGVYDFWQYSRKGAVDGISGNTDCNFWYTKEDIANANFNGGDLKQATMASVASQIYTGKAIMPSPALKVGPRTLKLNRDYKLTYSNNINPGKAVITAVGMGNYTGSISKTFTIMPNKVSTLTFRSASKKITLCWTGTTGGSGYEIYRSKTYKGTYKKVKTVKGAAKYSWSNKGLGANREYFYKIRAYAKVGDKTYYSSYVKGFAGTTPGGKAAVTGKKLTLRKNPSVKGKKLITIPANATIRYMGRTYLQDKKKFYHVQYRKGSKTYDGYLTSAYGLKYYKQKVTTAKTALQNKAGKRGKTLITIPKNFPIAVRGIKKAGKTTWYKTTYLKGKKLYTGYVDAGTLE